MGTWSYHIGHDDTFADVYECFFDHYNGGMAAELASQRVLEELSDAFTDSDDRHEAHFALALAQWETQTLDAESLKAVSSIIASGENLENWKDRSASQADLGKRGAALESFLKQISQPRRTKKRRKKPKLDIIENVLVNRPAPDSKKSLIVTEVYVNNEFTNTTGMVMWGDGGGGIFHFTQPGLECSAKWLDAQNLEIRFSNIVESDLQFGAGDTREAFFCGDRVSLSFLFD